MKKEMVLPADETQSGRSLTEMLAVLALIGLLIVSSFAIILYGLNKWRANVIVQDVALTAAAIITNNDYEKVGIEEKIIVSELKEMVETRSGHPLSAVRVEEDLFAVTVEKVSDRVCRLVVKGPNPSDFYVEVNGVSSKESGAAVCQSTGNMLIFYFDALAQHEGCGGTVCSDGFTCDADTLTCVCPSGKHEENNRCVCDEGLEECGGNCMEPCTGSHMTGFRDENSCLCLCDTGLGLEAVAQNGVCDCPVGSVFLDGRCQTFGCTGGTQGNQDWTCQIDGQRCGDKCFEDGSMCFNGLCTAGQCPNTPLAYIPVAALYGCLNENAVEGQDVICTKRNSVIHCYRADKDKKCGYYCSLTGKDCTWGDCEDRCTTDSAFPGLTYADSGSYEFWGCRNDKGLVCVSIGASATNYACYRDGFVCASGCTKDGATCLNNICDADNPCPAGSTYDPTEFTCTRADGVWCSLSPYAGSPRVMCFMPGGLASCGAICTWDGHDCNTGTCDASDCSVLGMDFVSVGGWYGCKDPETGIACLKRDNGNYFHCYKNGLLCGTTCTDYAAGGCSDCLAGYECPNGGTYIESGGYADNTCLYDNGLSCSPWTKNCFMNGLPCGTGCAIDGTGCASGVCTARDCPAGQEPVYDSESKLFTCATVDRTVSCTDGTCTINGSVCGYGCASDGADCSVGVCLAEECGDAVLTQISYQFYGCYSSETGTGCYRNGTTYTCWKNGSHCGDGCTINGTGGTCDDGCI